MSEVTVAIDVLGGDNAPESVLAGVEAALAEYELNLLLAGPGDLIEDRLGSNPEGPGSYDILPATERIGMDEDPISAVRQKKNSSLAVAADSVKEGAARAMVSAGNTGAVTVATKLKWGVRDLVDRPAIATLFPTADDGYTILIDVGANSDCTPRQLVQFGLMGIVYSEIVLDKENPSVGLLNLGEETVKGNKLTKEAFELFEDQPLNFIGNIEGDQINEGVVDVIVCDGFVGNVVLKLSEGLAETLFDFIKKGVKSSLRTRLGGYLLKPVFKDFAQTIDAAEVGGAPLLGLNGGCIIAHGDSSPKAIKNAIRVARLFIRRNFNAKIGNRMPTLNLSEESSS